MDEGQSTSGTQVTGAREPAEIRQDIETTRQQLGETVEALSAKTDVKARAKEKVADTKASAAEKKDELLGKAKQASPDAAVSAASQASSKARQNPAALMAVGAFAVGFLIGRISNR